jgi:hypothetical protein
MTKITIDNKGKPFRSYAEDHGRAYGEISDVTAFFWRITHEMVREILSSPNGGTLSITIPDHVASAEVDLALNPAPVAIRHEPTAIHQYAPSSECPGLSLHVEASGNGFNALLSAQEHIPAGAGTL